MTWQEILGIAGLISAAVSGGVTLLLKYIFQKNLDDHAEHLKHDLQKETIKAQLMMQGKHRVYPKLLELCEIAYAKIRSQSTSGRSGPCPPDEALNAVVEANNYFFAEMLYTTEPVSTICLDLFKYLNCSFNRAECAKDPGAVRQWEKCEEEMKKADALRQELRKLMRAELELSDSMK